MAWRRKTRKIYVPEGVWIVANERRKPCPPDLPAKLPSTGYLYIRCRNCKKAWVGYDTVYRGLQWRRRDFNDWSESAAFSALVGGIILMMLVSILAAGMLTGWKWD